MHKDWCSELNMGDEMEEASDETLTSLQELALLKKGEHPKSRNAAARQKRRKEIGKEIKQIADKKKKEEPVM